MEEEIMKLLRDFYGSVDEMINACKTYLDDYEEYEQNSRKDVSALKRRMAEMIIRGTDE